MFACAICTREIDCLIPRFHLPFSSFLPASQANSAVAKCCGALGVARHEMGIVAASRGWFAGLLTVREAQSGVAGYETSAAAYVDFDGDDDGGRDDVAAADFDDDLEDDSNYYNPSSSRTASLRAPGSSSRRRRYSYVSIAAGPPRPVPGEAVYSDLDGVYANNGAEFILVVEKECIFRRLTEDRIWDIVSCVLVTGCGFPDLATRAFVYRLHKSLRLPVLGLSDWNPFGMAIMLCYRNGSKSMPEANTFRVPLKWLGLRHDDLENFDLPSHALQPATSIDETRAAALLRDPLIADDDALRYEAERFLARREKMEVEGVLARGLEYLSDVYLPDKVEAQDWV